MLDVILPKFRADVIHVIEEHEVGRPDIIATRFFGNPLMYPAILQANAIELPYNVRNAVRGISEILNASENDTVEVVDPWYDYSSAYGGFVTELYRGRRLIIPNAIDAVQFVETLRK